MDSLKGTLTPMKVLNGTLNGGIAYGTFNYNELENKPSVNGTELVGNVTIDIPTKTSDLTNDSGFITDADVPTKTSDLTNDSGFITDADIPTKTSELTNDSGFITSADIPTIPTNTSQLNNDSGFLTMNTTPVRSVNSQTGDVNLFIPNATSQLNNDAGFLTESSQKITDMEDDITTLQGDVEILQGDIDNKADKSALTWTLLGETTGTAEQSLPTNWNELQVYGMFGGNAQYGFVAHTIKAHLGSNPTRYIQGGADKEGGTDHHIAIWHIEDGKIGLNFWRYNNTDYTSRAKLIVYYR